MNQKISNKIIASVLKEKYNNWKKTSIASGGYFIVFNTFLEDGFLNRLSGGAVKLYLYLGIVSKNNTGESFHSIESMAKYFKVSTRTISTWISELEKERLIERYQLEKNEVAYTFLKPY